jgi:redox-sensitive bicupin YhaK (pirin superfamily)
MMEPRYRGVTAAEIPEVSDPGGAAVRVIAGTVGEVTGPVRDVVTRPEYLDVTLPAGKTFTHSTPRGHTVFAYVIEGEGVFCRSQEPYDYEVVGQNYFDMQRERLISDGHLVWFGDGDQVSVSAEAAPVRFLLISGQPIGEPIAWQGPIVMNTQSELRVAFEDLEKGTFIRSRPQG